jgi:hypothetical protein
MTAFRRRLIATTWATVSAQVLALALGAVQGCWDREHTHGGAAAPDCAMHHQARAHADGAHSHHAQGLHTGPEDRSAPQITCRCAGDVRRIDLGQVAVLQARSPRAPFLQVALDPPGDMPAADNDVSPPLPPPR